MFNSTSTKTIKRSITKHAAALTVKVAASVAEMEGEKVDGNGDSGENIKHYTIQDHLFQFKNYI